MYRAISKRGPSGSSRDGFRVISAVPDVARSDTKGALARTSGALTHAPVGDTVRA